MRPAAPLCLLVMLGLAAPARAQAPDPDVQAQTHFQAGTSYFQVADYEAALREFEQAWSLSERPALMYNLYLCHERLGQLEPAVSWLGRYLADGGEIGQREVLEARLANMRRRLAEQATPVEEPLPPSTDPVAGTAEPVAEPLETRPAPEATRPMDAHFRVPLGAIVSFVAAGTFTLSFATLGSLALAEDASLPERCPEGCPEAETDTLRGLMVGADVSLALAGAAAVLGLVWTLLDPTETRLAESARLVPWVLTEGAGASVSGRL